MTTDGFWVHVAEMKTLGRAHFADVADELEGVGWDVDGLAISGDVFGVPGEGVEIVAGYHEVMHSVSSSARKTSEQVGRVGAALTKVAENYEAMDRELSWR